MCILSFHQMSVYCNKLYLKVSNQKAKFVPREHEIYHRITSYVIVFDGFQWYMINEFFKLESSFLFKFWKMPPPIFQTIWKCKGKWQILALNKKIKHRTGSHDSRRYVASFIFSTWFILGGFIFRKNCLKRGGFGKILAEVMIFSEGLLINISIGEVN